MTHRAQRVLVTGATSGIGSACARAFHRAGWQVVVTGRRQERLDDLRAELGCSTLCFDVRDFAATEAALADQGVFDVVLNNAGLSRGLEPIWQGSLDDWNEMLDTNVKGLLHVTRVLLPGMVEAGFGHVINIGSIAGHEAYPNGAVYCASKHAVLAITQSMRKDTCGTGVKVSTVDPGLVHTEFPLVRFHGDQERADSTYDGMTPLRGEDVAATVLWVAEAPAHVNVAEVLLLPNDQASAGIVARKGK